MRSKPVARRLAQGSSDEGEPAGGSGGGHSGSAGPGSESPEMEENGSLRSSSSSAGSERHGSSAYRVAKALGASGAGVLDAFREYHQQQGRSAGHRQLDYRAIFEEGRLEPRQGQHRHDDNEDERKPWDFSDNRSYEPKNYVKREHREDYHDVMKQESLGPKDQPTPDWMNSIPDSIELGLSSSGSPYIRARSEIAEGARFGPYIGNWYGADYNSANACEMLYWKLAKGSFEESKDWMKLIRVATNSDEVNVRKIKDKDGNTYFEAVRSIAPGEELLSGFSEPSMAQQQRRLNNEDENTSEYASQYSGASHAEEEREEEDDGEIRCTVCDKPFQDIEELNNHLVLCHRYPAREHCCSSCPSGYAWRPLLFRHRAIAHGDVRKYPCENCSKPDHPQVFTDPSILQRHIRTHHVGARSHACTECGKTFATSSGLKQHTHIHSSVKPFQCEVCFKAYTQFSNLCRHKRMHAKCRMQITCVKCNAQFSTVTSLSKHKRFCDSTAPPPSPVSSMPQPQPNPFLFPRQPLPFYPPNLIGHYSASLLRGASNILGLPLLMPPKPSSEEHSERRSAQYQQQHQRSESPRLERFTPPRAAPPPQTVQHQQPTSKVSPSAAEEATSSLRPSPARPPTTQPETEEIRTPKQSPEHQKHGRRPPNCEGREEPQASASEQPLDLRVQTKRRKTHSAHPSSSQDEVIPEPVPEHAVEKKKTDYSPPPIAPEEPPLSHASSSSRVKSGQQSDRTSSENKELNSASVRRPLYSLQVPAAENHQPERTPTPTPPPPIPHMAYPRPIHPLFLESMYRNPSNPFPSFPGVSGAGGPADHRLLQPLPSFSHARGLPFLGPLMNGLGGPRPGGYDALSRSSLGGFPGVKSFQDSMIAHHQQAPFVGKIKDRYSCKFCGKNFPRSANLTRHLRTHTGEQPYKCKYCERSFSISSNLQRHVRNIHDKQRPFKCPMCERCFGQQTNLDRHLKKHEADDGSGVVSVADSADSSNENEREETSTYFDEIRSFMGKVTYGGDPSYALPQHHPAYLSSRLHDPHDLLDGVASKSKFDDDEDSADRISPMEQVDGLSPLAPIESSPSQFDLKISSKRELLNNNTAEPVIEIST